MGAYFFPTSQCIFALLLMFTTKPDLAVLGFVSKSAPCLATGVITPMLKQFARLRNVRFVVVVSGHLLPRHLGGAKLAFTF
ncbi:hypothetical protein ACI0FS_12405 [Ochrobactrum quorumnocens]|uniref:hypothetical protein n=1 Tax=Ochrobactrum quorumnocens TaxID=271865 RepID=UPI0038548D9B